VLRREINRLFDVSASSAHSRNSTKAPNQLVILVASTSILFSEVGRGARAAIEESLGNP
jgi:hypothetical protein